MSKFCSECGHPFERESVKFCSHCGASQTTSASNNTLQRIPQNEDWRRVTGKPTYSTNQQEHYNRAIAVFFRIKALENYRNNTMLANDPSLQEAGLDAFLKDFMPNVEKYGMEYATARLAISDYLKVFVFDRRN